MAEVAADSGIARTGQTTWTFGTDRGVVHADPGRTRGARLPGPGRRGRRRSALQVFGSEDEAEARHRLGVRRLLLLELDAPGRPGPRRPDQRREARPRRVAVPHGRRAARRLPRRRRRARSSTRVRRSATTAAYDALRDAAAEDQEAQLRSVLADVLRVLDAWRRAEKALSGRADLAMLPALTDMRAPARPAGRTAGSSARPGPPSCAATRRTSPPSSCVASGCDDQVARDRQLHGPDRRRCRTPTCTRWTRCRTAARPARTCARCAGCSRSTASRCGRSTSARRIPSATSASVVACKRDVIVIAPPADDAREQLLRGARRRRGPGRWSARPPTGRPRCWCAARATPATPRSPTGCCTSPTPRASRRSPRSGRARRPTRWPAACGGSTCCGPGCTPTRRAWRASSRPASARAQVARVVAGVADPPGPDELKAMVDEVLRGIAGSDFADVLFRAAAFARVVATGRAALPTSHRRRGAPDAGAGRAARGRRSRRARSRARVRLVSTDVGDSPWLQPRTP